jgi:hypothetical protein
MAFSLDDLQQVGPGGNGPRIWTYTTTDAIADVNTAGYFDNGTTTNTGMRNVMNVGDLIYVNSSTGGTLVCTLTQVLSNASGIIDVADGTTLAATDTD